MTEKLKAFLRGVYEFRRNCTWADPARVDDLSRGQGVRVLPIGETIENLTTKGDP